MAEPSLLPSNSTPVERALEGAIDFEARYKSKVDLITGWKYRQPYDLHLIQPLVAEYGLGDLSEYVGSPTILLNEGVRWQRLRGTPEAIRLGLEWLGYEARLEEAPKRRRRWHLFQLELDRVRDAEHPDLAQIEGMMKLSVAVRSRFFRGYHGFDVRPVELSYSHTSRSYLSQSSGVRLRSFAKGGALWSFGRDHDFDIEINQSNLESLSAWIADQTGSAFWTNDNVKWADTDNLWTDEVPSYRRGLMAKLVANQNCWVEFLDAAGTIGFRRCRVVERVVLDDFGPLAVGTQRVAPGNGPFVYIEARTAFGDGDGRTATTARLRFGGIPENGVPPGILWALPGELNTLSSPIASRPVEIPFGKTVRERVRTLIRIP